MPETLAQSLGRVLDSLVDGRNRWGAVVATRDGLTAASRMSRPASDESFSAMAAASLAAAEAAMREWADDRPRHARLEGSMVHLALEALGRDHILVVASSSEQGPDERRKIAAAARQLEEILRREALEAPIGG